MYLIPSPQKTFYVYLQLMYILPCQESSGFYFCFVSLLQFCQMHYVVGTNKNILVIYCHRKFYYMYVCITQVKYFPAPSIFVLIARLQKEILRHTIATTMTERKYKYWNHMNILKFHTWILCIVLDSQLFEQSKSLG